MSGAKAARQIGADRLGHVIKRAEQALIARKTRVLRAFDLTVPQYAALLLLSGTDGMSGRSWRAAAWSPRRR